MSEQPLNDMAKLSHEKDAEDLFKSQVECAISCAELNQYSIACVLQELADEQMAEWDDREPCEA